MKFIPILIFVTFSLLAIPAFGVPPVRVEVQTNGFKPADLRKLGEAMDILERVINSEEFKNRVIAFEWKGERRFFSNKDLSNEEIYERIMAGEEVLNPGVDYTMNLLLKLYRSKNPWSRVPGYTLPGTMQIWLNKKYFRSHRWTSTNVAANLAHEWMHKLGFGHSYDFTPDRPFTVPYGVGHIVEAIADADPTVKVLDTRSGLTPALWLVSD